MVPNVRRFNRTRVRLEHSGEIEQTGDFSVLQPHEGSSGTSLRRESPSTGRCRFNRTRVRLEPRRSWPSGPARSGFNRTRVRLELGRSGITHSYHRASTARGFVWNSMSNVSPRSRSSSFNRTRVRLERYASQRSFRQDRCFNRTRVRLEHQVTVASCAAATGFNRTRVRLERSQSPWWSTVFGFNRTRVRLEQSIVPPRIPTSVLLQPHEGSSGTRHDSTRFGTRWMLQPHEGSSGTSPVRSPARSPPGFNRTRVRLEPGPVGVSACPSA